MRLIYIAMLCSLVVLAGCSGSASAPATSPSVAPTQQPATTTPKPATPTPEPAKTVNPDFREIKWGMTRDEIVEIEGEPDELNADSIGYYNLSVAGIDVILGYYFNDEDEVYRAIYSSSEEHTNRTDFISDYDNLVNVLSEKYGSPYENETIWKDDLYKDDPSDWGMAVCVGDLVKYANWETDNANIVIMITGENYEINTFIVYDSKKVSKPTVDETQGL